MHDGGNVEKPQEKCDASIHVRCTLVDLCKLIGLIGKEKIRPLPFSGK
jgi:hypothetical protein